MPVEIEELVIRVVVGPEPGAAGTRAPDPKDGTADLVQEITDRVLEILEQRKER
ncbi:MAG: hypothetical protein JNL97_15660 [Verrucomicrobiales bacterium]|nr:hypothetical protein [Verrucomicrobiales bacterium]